MRIRRVLAIAVALAFAITSAPVAAQKKDDKKPPKRSKAEQADVETLVRLVDGVSGGTQPAPTDVAITWESNHFVKGQDGVTYIPFTLTVDKAKLAKGLVAYYVRVVNKSEAAAAAAAAAKDSKDAAKPPARPDFPWDNINFIEIPASGKVTRAIQLKAGDYEAFVAIKEKAPEKEQKNAPPAKIGLARHDLKVPDFTANDLATSSIMMASNIEVLPAPLSQDKQEENPYTFGPMKVNLSPDAKFAKNGELNLVFWIYGAGAAAAGKPNVQVDYAFHQKLPEGEKYFNRTQPQVLNAESLPPEFDVAAGHQLPGTLTVPLASFPAGDYRLEIKITDKTSNKTLTQNVTFTVQA
jgi:hypothetical protein